MAELLKNYYNESFVQRLAGTIKSENKTFNSTGFIKTVFDQNWEQKELKQRMRHIAVSLNTYLPEDYQKALKVLWNIVPQFNGFTAMIFPDFVEVYGQNNIDASLKALEWFTQFSSAEFAIRPFILKDTERVMKQMLLWSVHDSHHVRRLSSEGCRPRLPWAIALPAFKKDPAMILPIIENLKEDPSEYVRRSVANNLNDIAKDHPGIVMDIVKKWKGNNANTDWIVKHASRGLLKKGVTEALANFDLHAPTDVQVQNVNMSMPSVNIGNDCTFSFNLKNVGLKPIKLRLEYGVYYVKANGKSSRKIFKISENDYEPAKEYSFKKKISFKNLTTRKHYPGKHKLVIVINGIEMGETDFILNV